ncbi:hypothetical protein ACFU9Y_16530 [Streptomyces sp. NPDC057621]|uniref:hypothetical protein n=1 Tax=unclassified Streptomyces TaxID=2593676 RepID=UPI0036D1A24D
MDPDGREVLAPFRDELRAVDLGVFQLFRYARRLFRVGKTTGTLSDRAGLLCLSYGDDTNHGGRA